MTAFVMKTSLDGIDNRSETAEQRVVRNLKTHQGSPLDLRWLDFTRRAPHPAGLGRGLRRSLMLLAWGVPLENQ